MVCERSDYICNVCNSFCLYRFFLLSDIDEQEMGKDVRVLDVSGYIFCNKINMRNNMGDRFHSHSGGIHRDNTVLHVSFRYYLHSLVEVIRQDFKTQSVGLKIADIFGLPSILFSILNIVFDNNVFSQMPSGFRYTIFLFACGYLLTLFLRGYEKYRADKLQNDKNEFLWQQEKKKLRGEK